MFFFFFQVNKHDPVMAIQHLPEVIEGSNTDIYAIVKVIDPDPGLDTNSNLFIYSAHWI